MKGGNHHVDTHRCGVCTDLFHEFVIDAVRRVAQTGPRYVIKEERLGLREAIANIHSSLVAGTLDELYMIDGDIRRNAAVNQQSTHP